MKHAVLLGSLLAILFASCSAPEGMEPPAPADPDRRVGPEDRPEPPSPQTPTSIDEEVPSQEEPDDFGEDPSAPAEPSESEQSADDNAAREAAAAESERILAERAALEAERAAAREAEQRRRAEELAQEAQGFGGLNDEQDNDLRPPPSRQPNSSGSGESGTGRDEPNVPSSEPDNQAADVDEPDIVFDDVKRLEVVTEYLWRSDELVVSEDGLPVGILLLSSTQTAKNAFLCDGFLRELRTHAEAKAAAPDDDFFVTYWPLQTRPASFESCDILLNHYDYSRAAQIRTLYGVADIEGPVLLAVDASNNSVFLDLTEASPEAARGALHSWLEMALEDKNASQDEDELVGVGEGVAAEAQSSAHRFTLVAISDRIKSRVLTNEGAALAMNERQLADGRTLFSYHDPESGIRIGSTIRF